MVVPMLAVYVSKHLGVREELATLPIAALGFGAILAAVIGGHLADTLGRRPVMLTALFGGAAMLLVLSRMTSIWSVTGCVFVFALVAEMYRPAGQAMIADLVAPADRPYAYSLTYIAINLGFAIGPALAGHLAKRSYNLLFLIDAGTMALYALLIVFFIRETLPGRRRVSAASLRALDAARPGDGRLPAERISPAAHTPPSDAATAPTVTDAAVALGTSSEADGGAGTGRDTPLEREPHVPLLTALTIMARHRAFVAMSAASLAVSLVYSQAMSTFPLYLRKLGIEEDVYGTLIGLNGLLIVMFQVPLSTWLPRFHRGRVVAMAALVTAAGFGMKALVTSPPMFAAAIGVWTLGEMMQAVFIFAIVSDMAPRALRARYMGVMSVCHGLGMALGAPLGGAVLGHAGGQALWLGCVLCGVAAAGLYWVVSRQMAGGGGGE